MKKPILVIVLIFATIFILVACTNYIGNPTSANFSGEDFFVYRDVVFLNMSGTWADDLDFERGEFFNEIRRSGTRRRYRNWDATVLPVGTRLYVTERHSSDFPFVLIAIHNDTEIIYLPMLEG